LRLLPPHRLTFVSTIMDENTRQRHLRLERISRIGSLTVAVLSASLLVFWLIKWIRGDPDEYRNQIVGGLTLCAAMTLLSAAQLIRHAKSRWVLLGAGALLVVAKLAMDFVHARIPILAVISSLLILGIIATTARALWPSRGVKFAEWTATAVTLQRRRSLCTGMAVLNLGLALFFVSLVGIPRGPWQATALAVFATLMLLGSAVFFVVLRLRLRA
jgi:hypothetical protein